MSSLPTLPPRLADSHKGNYGRALLIGGSRGMSGAIALASLAALRSGAGLVRVAVPDSCLDAVAAVEPSYMTAPLPCDENGRIALSAKASLAEQADRSTCMACGPGLGRSEQIDLLVPWLYQWAIQPTVLDADALNALAAGGDDALLHPGGPRILTPHEGEFRRLLGQQQREAPSEQLPELAQDMAKRCGVVVVLKGHHTLITDGQSTVFNQTGNPGMATGGSGDVLTGVISALICQGLEPFPAAQLGAHIHGLAGDLAAEELGQVSLIASDLIRFLPAAFRQHEPEA